MKRVVGLNTEDDKVSRTIKAKYWKTGGINFLIPMTGAQQGLWCYMRQDRIMIRAIPLLM